ncbi:PH domain-containing protein [Aeromicrobium sp.]|uniref:PH domain-containing protein n=1 Tax=Aeromicrobium sp. TaxID=1871063 RepID=UPI003D6C3767
MTTYRPVGARIVAYGASVALGVVAVVVGMALPPEITFTVAELITLALTFLAFLAILHGIARSYVRVDDDGLEILNGYRRHRIPWAVMRGISMNRGAPWPTLVLHDDDRVMLFAIQGSDGKAANDAVNDLVRRIG